MLVYPRVYGGFHKWGSMWVKHCHKPPIFWNGRQAYPSRHRRRPTCWSRSPRSSASSTTSTHTLMEYTRVGLGWTMAYIQSIWSWSCICICQCIISINIIYIIYIVIYIYDMDKLNFILHLPSAVLWEWCPNSICRHGQSLVKKKESFAGHGNIWKHTKALNYL
jgi:hypothetical protein